MSPNAIAQLPIHELLAKRTSPHIFDSRPVSNEDLLALFEAARWSASAGNEQAPGAILWRLAMNPKSLTGCFPVSQR